MKHAANTHAVDLDRGGIMCGTRYVDVVHAETPYLTCARCWRRLRYAGFDMTERSRLPKVYLVTGLRVVRDGKPNK